jgi:hypothetical protein
MAGDWMERLTGGPESQCRQFKSNQPSQIHSKKIEFKSNPSKVHFIQTRPSLYWKFWNKIRLWRSRRKEQLSPHELLQIRNGFQIKILGSQGLFLTLGNYLQYLGMDQKFSNLHGGMKSNLEHFSCSQLLPILHLFWINLKILREIDLKELWTDRLLEILIANPSRLHFRQQVLDCDLQGLYYDMGDLHTPYPNIEEDMEFIKVSIVKQKLEENFPSLGAELYSPI